MADEVWRLQRGSEADCIFFQHAVNKGKRITGRGSYQGTWILAPSGKLLAHINTRNIDKQLKVMRAGLEAWEALSPEERRLPPGAEFRPTHRWELNYPEGGLVLERIGRELVPEGLAGEPHRSWNVDYAWASREEILGQTQMDFIGRGGLSESNMNALALRLARFHLIDNVRGQSIPFAEEEIQSAELRAIWQSDTPQQRTLLLRGHTKALADNTWRMGDNSWKPARPLAHGIECELSGVATWDKVEERFTRFELVAVGKRWGRTQNNGRGRDPSPGRVAFHFEIPAGKRRVAPTFVSAYAAPWIVQPAIAEWIHSPEECGLESGGY